MNAPPVVSRVISGGQTGVDRAALDTALARGVPCGGWCPRGRRAEDGTIPASYPLVETSADAYDERTRRNVEDSDGTLVLTRGAPSGGTALTIRLAEELGKPWLVIDLDAARARPDREFLAERAREWIREYGVSLLNVAGPRESGAPGIGEEARTFLDVLLAPSATGPG